MNRADQYSLLLLAGGKSLRMGQDKASLCYEGKTFLENLIKKAKQLGIKQLYLSGHEKTREEIKVIWDIYPGIGPLGGIHAGMKNISTKYFLLLPVDVPQIPADFLESLLSAHEQQILDEKKENRPLLVERDGFMEPLMGVYPVDMIDFLEEKIKAGRLSVFRMLQEWGYQSFQTDIEEWKLANINTAEDYEMLIQKKKECSE